MATRKRPYVKAARAGNEAETRERIVNAVVALHEEIGPRRTTIKSIADRAGVQRLTVYRHFPRQRELIAACSAQWNERHPPPPIPPTRVLTRRQVRILLLALYRYYRDGEGMLAHVLADAPFMPELRGELAAFDEYLESVALRLATAWGDKSARRRATLRHAVEFTTWRSLAAVTRNDKKAVDLVFNWCSR